MSQRLHRSHARYAAPAAPAHGATRARLQRRRLFEAPFPPAPDIPHGSPARGITFGAPIALAMWSLVAISVAPSIF